eukprot:g29729.t1
MLRKVQDAYQVLEELRDPTFFDGSSEDGLPQWATGLLEGIEWSSDEIIGEQRIRVPVFEPAKGGTPYLYAPGKPKTRVQLKRTPFKRMQSLQRTVQRDGRSLLRD